MTTTTWLYTAVASVHFCGLIRPTGRNVCCSVTATCLLDATYRTTRYAVPLSFVNVRTNIDYTVVGTFVTHYKDGASIAKALEVLRDWNPSWKAQSFIVDFCEPERMVHEAMA